MIPVEVSQKMTGLTKKHFSYIASRILSIALAFLSGAIFLFAALSGYYTWKQGFYDPNGMSIETALAAIEAMILLPGLAPMLSVFYFFIYLKVPIYNLIGFAAMFPIVFFHFVFSIPATHSSLYKALSVSVVELALIIILMWLFNKFIVNKNG